MIPRTPQTYRIPEVIRSEIVALMSDLDLVFIRKSFVPCCVTFGNKGVFVPVFRLKVDLKNHVYASDNDHPEYSDDRI